MPKSNYIAGNDDAFAAQLNLFTNNIGAYSAVLGLTPAQIAAQAADAVYFNYALECQEIMQGGAQQWTTWKDLTRDGGSPPPTGSPVAPVLPAVVPVVAPGVENRFRAMVKSIKANTSYNVAIGNALGIEGAQQTAPDLTTVQPALEVDISGGRVEVDWGWQGNAAFLDMCELQVDRGDGKGYVLLAYDTTPGYVDTQTFPATPTKWTYKAIYRVNDAQTGQWSNPVTITVGI
jgi:hypothetical protein